MDLRDLPELHCIVHMDNVPSILERGILCHERADDLPHISIAAAEIQARRRSKKVPGGLPLHEYANLYINARNTMMFRVQHEVGASQLAVLGISTDVLQLPGVVMSDMNAAASDSYVRFRPYPEGLTVLNREYVFAESWIHPNDQIETWRHRSAMCAEVLVPDCVEPDYIRRIHVSNTTQQLTLTAVARGIPVDVTPRLFFQ